MPVAAGRNASVEPIRVGLIGYGYAGRCFHAPLIQSTPGLALAAVCSTDSERVRAQLPEAELFGTPLGLLLSGCVDLVVVASPNATHVPLTEAALTAGIPVVVEKPFTPTLEEARTLLARAQESGVALTVFQNRRWDSDYLSVREAIRGGELGRVLHFESRMDRRRPQVQDRWRERPGAGAGLWFDLGPHLVDQALQLFGLPDRVSASFAAQREGTSVEDWAHVVLDYGASRAVLHCSTMAHPTHRFCVHGTRGSALKRHADPQEAQLIAGMNPGAPGWGEDKDPLVILDAEGTPRLHGAKGDQRRFYEALMQYLRGAGPNPVPGIQALAVTAVLDAAACSAREGRARSIAITEREASEWRASMDDGHFTAIDA